jgi:uncharacterized protein
MSSRKLVITLLLVLPVGRGLPLHAGEKGLVNTTNSPHSAMYMVDLGDVQWTRGFWANRFQAVHQTIVPHMWNIFQNENLSHAWANFLLAAGLDDGRDGKHHGPAFNDGDFYKWFEAVAAVYAQTRNPKLDQLMDRVIEVIAKAQLPDGYLHTRTIIAQNRAKAGEESKPKEVENRQEEAGNRTKTAPLEAFAERLHFETYNMGHLMTAACVHYRATGKTSLLDVAKKACNFLYAYYRNQTPQLARSAICPSHYMGVVEMYRTTGDPPYRELAKQLIEIRGMVEDGTDDNQDRVPFRELQEAVGHAVRANYLFAGVADVYAESGDKSLMDKLERLWRDVVYRKMYITGATGAVYDGVSPYGSREYHAVQRTHQAYGHEYQLPNITAYNESCATIGNLLWNWRMLLATGEERYADIVELALYNGVLPAISLEGKHYFYVNPLRTVDNLTLDLRWSRTRKPYYSSFCCPPNVVRTLAQAQNYCYTLSKDTLWVQLYGANTLDTEWKDGGRIRLGQETDYPSDYKVKLTIEEAPEREVAIKLRVPSWVSSTQKGQLLLNKKPVDFSARPGSYAEIKRVWKPGDSIHFVLPATVDMIEANPKVEEARSQVAVRYGPLIYCLESQDLPGGKRLNDVALSFNSRVFEKKKMEINGVEIVGLEIKGLDLRSRSEWGDEELYRPLGVSKPKDITFTMIPYFAWGNRGKGEMSVWLPLR